MQERQRETQRPARRVGPSTPVHHLTKPVLHSLPSSSLLPPSHSIQPSPIHCCSSLPTFGPFRVHSSTCAHAASWFERRVGHGLGRRGKELRSLFGATADNFRTGWERYRG